MAPTTKYPLPTKRAGCVWWMLQSEDVLILLSYFVTLCSYFFSGANAFLYEYFC
jgi:hypothetical protein